MKLMDPLDISASEEVSLMMADDAEVVPKMYRRRWGRGRAKN